MRRRKIYIATILAILSSSFLLLQNDVHARSEVQNTVTEKALLQGAAYCYKQGAIDDTVDSILTFTDFPAEQIKDSSPYGNGDYVALPSGLTLVMDNNIDCRNLFRGWRNTSWDKLIGVFPLFNIKYKAFSNDNDHQEKRDFLEGMGYTKQASSGNCITYEYDYHYYSSNDGKYHDETKYTKNVCVKNGEFDLQEYNPYSRIDVPISFTLSSDNKTITKLHTDHKFIGLEHKGALDAEVDISASDSDWQTQLNSAISGNFERVSLGKVALSYMTFNRQVINGEGDTTYKITGTGHSNKFAIAADKAIKYISGGKYNGEYSLKFSKAEQVSYYIQVIKEWFYDGASDVENFWACDKSDWSMYGSFTLEIKRTSSGDKGNCRLDPDKVEREDEAYGFKSDIIYDGGEEYRVFDSSGDTKLTLAELVEALNALSDSADDSEVSSAASSEEDTSEEAEKNCQNQGGAGSLGWIVCGILDWMQDATEGLYDSVVEPALKVETTLFENDGGSSVEEAWEYFRNFANIIFIILVLFVIFSQLTGVGIDNYGIKKILPKLIVAAVLVNLSYLICLICVDISNIVGNGVQNLFNSINIDVSSEISLDISGNYTDAERSFNTGAAINTGIIAVGTVTSVVGVVAIYSNPALLLTLFVSVLGVFISILFVFILLAGRKAAIILLTVISPVAFILYILPNTKKIFDKWFNLWKAMLLVYPICGLLIGGGNFASKLMMAVAGTSTSPSTVFVAMIVGIVPIFFIPTVIKGAYAAIGSAGGLISGFGDRMRGGATKGIRNSNAYKNAQQMGLDRKTRKQAGLNKQGDATKVGKFQRRLANSGVGRFFGADRMLNARTKAAKKDISEQEEGAATSMEIMAAAEMGKTPTIAAVDGEGNVKEGQTLFAAKSKENYYANKFLKAAQKGDRKAMNAALSAAKSAGVKDKDISKMVRHAVNSKVISGKNNDRMSVWLQQQASSNGAFAKDIELQNWAAKGGTEELGGYGDYAKATGANGQPLMSPSDLDKGKIGNASAESIAGLAKAGILPPSLAEEALLDDSMNLSPDKRILLGAIQNGRVNKSASAEDIRRDAEILSADPSANVSNITANAAEVENWAAPAPTPVTISQQKTTAQRPPVPDGYTETKSGIIYRK